MNNRIHLKEYIEKVIDLRFSAAEQALRLNREELNRRLEGLNELRKDVEKDRNEFVRAETYDTKHKALDDLVRSLENRMITMETRSDNKARNLWIGLVISIIIAILSFAEGLMK